MTAAFGLKLHLIEPLGFSLADRYLRRAGLDYWEFVSLQVWKNFADYLDNAGKDRRLILTSARQGTDLHKFTFTKDDALVFGRESSGLPQQILALSPFRVRIPIHHNVRSLNLATSAGIITYQAMLSVALQTGDVDLV